MFCPNCGTQNTETAATCAKCGFQLKTAAAPKFKGTMLMMNQPGAIPGAPPRPGSSPAVPPPGGHGAGGHGAGGHGAGGGGGAPAPASGPGFTAEAPPIGAGGPPAGAGGGVAPPSRLKGTIVGVAPPNFGAAPAGGSPMDAAPAPAEHQTFGSSADANPLAGTMALDGPPNFANVAGAPVPPAFGAPPPDAGGFNPAPYGAPPADGGFGAPPPGGAPGGDPYGSPGAAPAGAPSPYGAPPGGDPYGQGAPPNAYGAPPGGMQGGPMGGPPPQDYGAQQGMNPGFQQQPGQAYGQPPQDQFGQPNMGGGMQPYGGGAPMMGPQGMNMGGMAVGAGGPPKQWMITLILALLPTFGIFGAHRFYTGHYLYGAIQFFTLGGCGVWQVIDLIAIFTGKYTDSQGRPLVKS